MASTTSNIAFGNAHSSVQANNINGSVHIGLENTLDRLPRAENAPFNSYTKQHEHDCLPDTRVDLLQEIYCWADGQDERCLFWLNGLAGTGKSTIARTVAGNYYAKQHLAASFFFSRGGGDVSHADMFVTSIAVQLADNVPSSRSYICDAIAKRSDIARQSLRDQWQQLILYPLSKLCKTELYIIVVDALDECDKDSNIRIIIQLLAEMRPSLTGARLRVLLTSRPEVPIRHGFRQIADSQHKDVVLHNISPSIVDHDIGLFIKHCLGDIAKTCYHDDDWPGIETIQQLVQSACGLFIWAATACRFIQEGGQFSDDRLRIILKSGSGQDRLSSDSSSSEDSYIDDQLEILPEKRLDSIYLTVLKRPVGRFRKSERKKWYKLMKEILGAIVLLHSPLSAISLARLLILSAQEVYRALDELHSILDVRNIQIPMDSNLWVDEKQAHAALADKCIKVLSSLLKRDACGVSDFGARAAEMGRTQLDRCILPETQYACLYWTSHLVKSGFQLQDNDQVHEFLKKHFLHWLEALSWMGKVSEGIYAITSLESIASTSDCPALYAFLHDMKRFALYSRSPIELAPLQLYSSALVFAPVNSIVRKQFADQLNPWIKSLPQVDDDWSACLQTLEGHSGDIFSMAFSHDSTRLASLSHDMTAKIWDVRSGECLQTIEISGYLAAFSHDLTLLASGSYTSTAIEIWDLGSGVCVHTLEGHETNLNSVTFSREPMRLATASNDGTINIWDVCNSALLHTLKLDNNDIDFITFSHDWKHLAVVVPFGETIEIQEAGSGECLQTLEGHSGNVVSVAFSRNSVWLASGSDDHTVKIWDISSSQCLQTLDGLVDSLMSVTFSHDSMRLAIALVFESVKVWDVSSGACLQTYEGHSDPISSVAFSNDSTQLASGSQDQTIRIWDANSNSCLRTHEGSKDNVSSAGLSHYSMQQILDMSNCDCLESCEERNNSSQQFGYSIALSHDLTLMAVGLNNGTIEVEDRKTMNLLKTLKGHCSPILGLVFSQDMSRLASTSLDITVKIWDIGSGACLQTIENYGHSHFTSIAFPRNLMLLAMGFVDGAIKIWNISSGSCLQELYWHHVSIDELVFSDDSTQLASRSIDGTIVTWDINSGTRLQTLKTCKLDILANSFHLADSQATGTDQQIDCGVKISEDNIWISYNGQERLWLPVEYRPGHFAMSDSQISVCTHSGRIWTCRFV